MSIFGDVIIYVGGLAAGIAVLYGILRFLYRRFLPNWLKVSVQRRFKRIVLAKPDTDGLVRYIVENSSVQIPGINTLDTAAVFHQINGDLDKKVHFIAWCTLPYLEFNLLHLVYLCTLRRLQSLGLNPVIIVQDVGARYDANSDVSTQPRLRQAVNNLEKLSNNILLHPAEIWLESTLCKRPNFIEHMAKFLSHIASTDDLSSTLIPQTRLGYELLRVVAVSAHPRSPRFVLDGFHMQSQWAQAVQSCIVTPRFTSILRQVIKGTDGRQASGTRGNIPFLNDPSDVIESKLSKLDWNEDNGLLQIIYREVLLCFFDRQEFEYTDEQVIKALVIKRLNLLLPKIKP